MVTIKRNILFTSVAIFGALFVSSCATKGPGGRNTGEVEIDSSRSVVEGLITMRGGVDVTSDDGSLMAEQLQLGDKVFIVTQPAGGSRPGWARISRSVNDTNGFGWVESRSVRSIPNMRKSSSGSGTAVSSFPNSGGSSGFGNESELMDGVGSQVVDESALEDLGEAEDIAGGSIGDSGDSLLDDLNESAPADDFDNLGDEEVNFDDIFE